MSAYFPVTKAPSFFRVLPIVLAWLAFVPSARAWSCKGHEIVALIAEAHLNPHARAMAFKILADGPISPALSRYCKEPGLDPFVDSSTWADDERTILPDTAPWHFIDIPLGANESDITTYCPTAASCITAALTDQLRILRNEKFTPQARADALRYIIHLVGDIHQPLHDATNNDRGGNCVPVTFIDNTPQERNPDFETYSPNLHSVWDVDIIDQLLNGETPQQAADEVDKEFHARDPAWQSQPSNFSAWAWEGHLLASSIVYDRLPVKIPIEKPRPVESCADDDHISTRMLHLNEVLAADYQSSAAPVAREQLAKAGIRLAALLNSLWP